MTKINISKTNSKVKFGTLNRGDCLVWDTRYWMKVFEINNELASTNCVEIGAGLHNFMDPDTLVKHIEEINITIGNI